MLASIITIHIIHTLLCSNMTIQDNDSVFIPLTKIYYASFMPTTVTSAWRPQPTKQ